LGSAKGGATKPKHTAKYRMPGPIEKEKSARDGAGKNIQYAKRGGTSPNAGSAANKARKGWRRGQTTKRLGEEKGKKISAANGKDVTVKGEGQRQKGFDCFRNKRTLTRRMTNRPQKKWRKWPKDRLERKEMRDKNPEETKPWQARGGLSFPGSGIQQKVCQGSNIKPDLQ